MYPVVSSPCQVHKERVSAFLLSKYSTSAKTEKRGWRGEGRWETRQKCKSRQRWLV